MNQGQQPMMMQGQPQMNMQGQPQMNMQGQQSSVTTDMYEGAKKSWENKVGGTKAKDVFNKYLLLNHLHQFIYQHLKNHFRSLVNNLRYFTYVTDKKFHTGISITEFDFHIARKHGYTNDSREQIATEYIKILGNPLKNPNMDLRSTTKSVLNYFIDNKGNKNEYLKNDVMTWDDSNSYFKLLKIPTSQTNEEGYELEKAYNEVIKNIREKSKDTFVKIFYKVNLGIFRGGKTKNKKSKKNSTRRKH